MMHAFYAMKGIAKKPTGTRGALFCLYILLKHHLITPFLRMVHLSF